jgi:hypothetical protein
MITEADLGWMAGILDFQGHVVRKNNKSRAEGSQQIAIYVDTSITAITARLNELTGTKVITNDHEIEVKDDIVRKGCAEHCETAHIHVAPVVRLKSTTWTLSGAAASIALWSLQRYMVSTHEPWQWAMAMGFASTRLTGRGATAALLSIRRMASYGWDLPPLFRDCVPQEEREAR